MAEYRYSRLFILQCRFSHWPVSFGPDLRSDYAAFRVSPIPHSAVKRITVVSGSGGRESTALVRPDAVVVLAPVLEPHSQDPPEFWSDGKLVRND